MKHQTTSHASPNQNGDSSGKDNYADVADLFRALASLVEGSEEHQCLRSQIAERCLPLAAHIAQKYNNRGETGDDLVQVARLGLMHAIDRFDPEYGSDFVSFAVPTVTGEVRRHFRDSGWAVQVPRRLKELRPQISKTEEQLAQQLGHMPSNSEIAEELGLKPAEIAEGLAAGSAYSTMPIDVGPTRDEHSAGVEESFGEVDDNFERVENQAILNLLLATLPTRERRVVMLSFFQSLTQRQIADRMGISQMHVSRLLATSLSKLRMRFSPYPSAAVG